MKIKVKYMCVLICGVVKMHCMQDEVLQEMAEKMEEEVRSAMEEVLIRPLQVLELIDEVQRLGLGHRFEKDILEALERVVSSIGLHNIIVASPHKSALVFKLFRQHGFEVSQGLFLTYCVIGLFGHNQTLYKGY